MFRGFVFTLLCFSPFASLAKISIHNTAQDFQWSWQKSRNLKLSERVLAFKRDVMPRFPSFYAGQFKLWRQSGRNVDQDIQKNILEFESISTTFVPEAAKLQREIEGAIQTFKKRFPDLEEDFKIFIIHSLGELDGGVRIIGDKEYLVFGVENILKFHDFEDRSAFILHELFHIYHFQKYPEKFEGFIWEYLWIEGLAVYASSVLNPKASLSELMLNVPKGLVEKSEVAKEVTINQILSAFNSTNSADYARLFQLSNVESEIPSRAGYYFGLLIARKLGESYSIERLSTLAGQELKSLIKKELETLLNTDINFSWNKDLPQRGKS